MNYNNIASLALNQIADKGRDVVLRYVTEGVYNPATDIFAGNSTNNVTVKAVIRDYKLSELTDTMILVGDKEIIVAASGLTEPQINDIIVDEYQFRILNILKIKPGDTTILYKLHVRLFALNEILRITEELSQRVTEAGINRILEN